MINLMFIRHAQTELNKEGVFAGTIDCNITKKVLSKQEKF